MHMDSANSSVVMGNVTRNAIGQHDLHSMLFMVVTSAISFAGSVFFLLLFTVFLTLRDVWNGSRMLLVHLTVLQFTLCSVQLPLQNVVLYQAMHGHPVNVSCRWELLIYVSTMTAINWSSLFLAVLRFLASAAPHMYQSCISRGKLWLVVGLSWTISLSFNVPIFFERGAIFTNVPPFDDCGIIPKNGIFLQVYLTVSTYLPVLATVTLYLGLFLRMKVQSAIWNKRTHTVTPTLSDHATSTGMSHVPVRYGQQHRGPMDRRLVVTRMLFVSEIWNCICYVPTPIFIGLFPQLFWTNMAVRLWTVTAIVCGYAFSPLIFFLLNAEYRARLRQLLSCHTRN